MFYMDTQRRDRLSGVRIPARVSRRGSFLQCEQDVSEGERCVGTESTRNCQCAPNRPRRVHRNGYSAGLFRFAFGSAKAVDCLAVLLGQLPRETALLVFDRDLKDPSDLRILPYSESLKFGQPFDKDR